MIKVLHLFTTLDNGGVESFLYNYYSNMNHDEIIFDFVVPDSKKGYLENEMVEMKSTIYHVPRFKKNPVAQIMTLKKIIKNGNYDIIHCHGYKSVIGIVLGKIYGIKVRITHSHMAYVKENTISKIIRILTTFIIKKFSTNLFACGVDSAKWLYGSKYYNTGKVSIINNAVDLDKFKFDMNKRDIVRKELNVKDEILIGNIARLSKQKNQIYSINLIERLVKIDSKFKLVLIGSGEDELYLKEEVNRKKLNNNVIFLGLRKDIEKLLSGLDIVILPSLYEGLPVVLAEVQASGTTCLVSDNVTKEIAVTSNIYYLPLDDDYICWINKIREIADNNNLNRLENNKMMRKGKYDIKHQAKKLFDFYKNIIGGESNE